MPDPNPSATDIGFRLPGPVERLPLRRCISRAFVFTTNLEDQVLSHLIVEPGIAVDVVTLDTDRLFPDRYEIWAATETRYGLRICPNALANPVREAGNTGNLISAEG